MGGFAHTKMGKQEWSPAFQMIYGALWMAGIAVLAITGWWWPGIMVVVAITSAAQAIYGARSQRSHVVVTPAPAIPPAPVRIVGAAEAAPRAAARPAVNAAARMPTQCRSCGAGLGHDLVLWRGERAAVCAYCNTPVPLDFGPPEAAR